jgi:hypothetical protein
MASLDDQSSAMASCESQQPISRCTGKCPHLLPTGFWLVSAAALIALRMLNVNLPDWRLSQFCTTLPYRGLLAINQFPSDEVVYR